LKVAGELAARGGCRTLYYDHTLSHDPQGLPGFKSRYWNAGSKPLYPFGYGPDYLKNAVGLARSLDDLRTIGVDVNHRLLESVPFFRGLVPVILQPRTEVE
jgi:hypothetical protein